MADTHDVRPDEPMTPEEAAVAASLSAAMVERIDARLVSYAQQRPRKVAMVIGLTMGDMDVSVPGLPDVYYAQRIKALVAKALLVAEGNLDYMRYSEIRRADPTVR